MAIRTHLDKSARQIVASENGLNYEHSFSPSGKQNYWWGDRYKKDK
jgi:Tol biopolymer transport system component